MELELLPVTEPNNKYSYLALIYNLINYNKIIADSRLLAERWKKDMATHGEVTNPAGANIALTARTACLARSPVVTLIARPHLKLFTMKN